VDVIVIIILITMINKKGVAVMIIEKMSKRKRKIFTAK
jgi:hypothetical protein